MAEDTTGDDGASTTDAPRRGFLTVAVAAITSAIVGAVPAVTGLLFFLDPLIRRKAGGANFVRLPLKPEALEDDGPPQQVKVIVEENVDAWNTFFNVPVGSVWLRKIAGQVIAFNTLCPHLGCSVDYRPAEQDYYCPCHRSAFDLDGKRTNEIPPRDMDTLDVKIDEDGFITVQYQEFRTVTEEKTPV